ncbi:MAG: LysR family transcriptional regulator [Armatimonadetes bacterium]|nr:LysR family transcriptional regulator [Akkermansiaceae bacterium]
MAGISLRHLEVFSTAVREGSYANAALELQMRRPNVKRVCEDFAKLVGRDLLTENENHEVVPTHFGQGLFAQLGPLSTSLRKMEEGVKQLLQGGRVLRFGAASGFFRVGLFTDYLSRLNISGKFRSCFLKVDGNQAHKSLLAAECDVYFGIGLGETERLDRIELGEVGWNISRVGDGALPAKPKDLKGKWFMVREGDADACAEMMERFRSAGARGGEIVDEAPIVPAGKGDVVFQVDVISPLGGAIANQWPQYQFAALMRRHHPYADLKEMLIIGGRK